MPAFILISAIILLQNVESISSIDPLVDSKVGLIRGLTSEDGTYFMFMGIPYGVVNETNPFGDASPHPAFRNTFKAYDDSSLCPQVYLLNRTILGSLDCLRLNIYVPSTVTSRTPAPVLVWIHGGGFRIGSGGRFLYGPGYIVRHDVILVTINYRLGPYGFMCLDLPEVPGNQGLKDQLMALRWIKENIDDFGGDVNQITLFGESAGGHSTELHLLSPKEKLFNKVMMQSSSAVAGTVLIQPDKTAPLKLAEHLGYFTDNLQEALKFLVNTPTNLVIAASINLNIQFRPCVETHFDGIDAFLINSWINVKIPKVSNMPVLIGFNADELMLSHENQNAEHFANLDIFTRYFKQTFNFNKEQLIQMENVVRQFYLGDEVASEDTKSEVIHYDSDFTYIHPVQRSIKKFIESGASDIYYYMFAYSGGRNYYKRLYNVTTDGAAHADELGYLFDMRYIPEEPTPKDQLIIDRMTTMWTNFAKYSDPTPQITELLPIKWIPLTQDHYNYLKIDTDLSIGRRPYNQRMAFWDLFYECNSELQKGYQ